LKLALNGMTFSATDDLESTLNIAKGFNIKNLELWAHNIEDDGDIVQEYAYKGKDIKSAKSILEKHDINVCCVAFGCGFDKEFVKQQELFTKELIRAIEVAADFEAEIVNHYCDYVLRSIEIDFPLLEKYWEPAVRRAEQLGVILALENEGLDVTRTPKNVLSIIKHFDSKNFKTNFDATNYYQSSNEPFPYSYEILKGHIVYVHIKNGCVYNPLYCKDEKWIGGKMTGFYEGEDIYYLQAEDGIVNNDGLLSRLESDGYNGYVTLEPHTSRENAMECVKNEVLYLNSKGIY